METGADRDDELRERRRRARALAAANLRQIAREGHHDAREIAGRTGLSERQVGRYLSGESEPTLVSCTLLEEALGCEHSDVVTASVLAALRPGRVVEVRP